jgi:hypothetical protein
MRLKSLTNAGFASEILKVRVEFPRLAPITLALDEIAH